MALRILVLPTGAVDRVQVEISSGTALRDAAACAAASRWRLMPAHVGGAAIQDEVLQEIEFCLR